jgi:hypothetical protein
MLRSVFHRPSVAALVAVMGSAFHFAACSDDGQTDAGAGGTPTSTGGVAPTTGGASTGGSSTGGVNTGGTTVAPTGGSTGGIIAGGGGSGGSGGTPGSKGGAGAGGKAMAGAGGALGGAGSGGSVGGGAGGTLGGGGAGGAIAGGGSGGATTGADDFDPKPTDFECISKWEKVSGFHITNKAGKTAEAVAVAKSATGGVYPVGTIIQHLPTEAMVKRKAGFSAATKDWEFFKLTITGTTTAIAERGTTAIQTMGQACASCHMKAPSEYDFVCNIWGDQGSMNCGFNLGDSQLNSAIDMDTRCD